MTSVRDPALSALQRRAQRVRRHRSVLADGARPAPRGLPDEVLQELFGIGMAMRITRGRVDSPPVADRIGDHLEQLQQVIGTIRRAVAEAPSDAPQPRRPRASSADHRRRGPVPGAAARVDRADRRTSAVDGVRGRSGGEAGRGARLAAALVRLTDTVIAGDDLAELLQYLLDTSVDLLDAAAAGLVLADRDGRLSTLAASSAHSERLQVVQIRTGRGPCVDCYTSGEPQSIGDLTTSAGRWPQFADLALEQEVRSVHAVPMRLRGRVIGALNLYRSVPGELAEPDRRAVQSLADAATIGILQHRDAQDTADLDARLEHALAGRAVIDQATGILAQYAQLDMDQAFTALRTLAEHHHLTVTALAGAVVDRRQHPADLLFGRVPAPRTPAEQPLEAGRSR